MKQVRSLDYTDKNIYRARWLMLSFALGATILNYVDRLAFNYLSAAGELRHLISNEAFGYIGTAFFIGYTVSNLFSGFIIDKLGTRLGYACCMAFWTTASLLQAIATLPIHFGILRTLLGIGEAGNWPAAIKLTSEWFPPEERSTAMGIFNSGASIGALITPPLAIWLGEKYGWQIAFIVIGVCGYLLLALFWFNYYTPKRTIKESKARIIPPLKLIRTRFVSWFTLSKVFMDPIWYFITFWVGRYLVDVYGWNLKKIGWFVMIPFFVAELGNILGGLFTQFIIRKGISIPKARKISVGLFGTMLGLSLILGPLLISSAMVALAILSIAGFSYAAYTANTMAFPADVVPQSATASVWGVASVGAGLGGAIFEFLSGIAVKNISEAHNYATAYNTVFIGYGIMALVALIIVLFLMGPLVKNPELFEYIDDAGFNTTLSDEHMVAKKIT
ncbi:MAG: MFS transporter [Chitinophagaceae bacterium]|nr:MAG: MFS transporter [Chitinophagaceae bacterium]